ncbi:MAG: polymer-forming cytoskeletal protein [Gemmatimonadetes bacterium]|nr:MAG: polymer-forming cytoskeletal protein [Gemmatimonadota bacterium]
MAKNQSSTTPPEAVISIIGPKMHVNGNLETEGTVRIEGTVHGNVRAGKAVVVGKDGVVDGDIDTQDAIISGRVTGTLVAASRLEVQATSRIEGEVRARRMQLDEGALLSGSVHVGELEAQRPSAGPASTAGPRAPTAGAASPGASAGVAPAAHPGD